MGNTVARSHIRDTDRGVAKATRVNTRRNSANATTLYYHQPLSIPASTSAAQSTSASATSVVPPLNLLAAPHSSLPPPSPSSPFVTTSNLSSPPDISSSPQVSAFPETRHSFTYGSQLPPPTAPDPPPDPPLPPRAVRQRPLDESAERVSQTKRRQRHASADIAFSRSASITSASVDNRSVRSNSSIVPRLRDRPDIRPLVRVASAPDAARLAASDPYPEHDPGPSTDLLAFSSPPRHHQPSALTQATSIDEDPPPPSDNSLPRPRGPRSTPVTPSTSSTGITSSRLRSDSNSSYVQPPSKDRVVRIDPTLPGATLKDCQAARTQTPPRVDKPPRARKVVSFNDNIHVVTYPYDGSDTYSSNSDVPSDTAFQDAKPPKRRGRSVFRLLAKVSSSHQMDITPPEEDTHCYPTQYDSCYGIHDNQETEVVYGDMHHDHDHRDLVPDCPPSHLHFPSFDSSTDICNEHPVIVSFERSTPPPVAKFSYNPPPPGEGAVLDDFDYTERSRDSDNEDTLSLSDAHPSCDGIDEPEAIGDQLLSPSKNPDATDTRITSSFDIAPLWQRLKRVDELDAVDQKNRQNRLHSPPLLHSAQSTPAYPNVPTPDITELVRENLHSRRRYLQDYVKQSRNQKDGLMFSRQSRTITRAVRHLRDMPHSEPASISSSSSPLHRGANASSSNSVPTTISDSGHLAEPISVPLSDSETASASIALSDSAPISLSRSIDEAIVTANSDAPELVDGPSSRPPVSTELLLRVPSQAQTAGESHSTERERASSASPPEAGLQSIPQRPSYPTELARLLEHAEDLVDDDAARSLRAKMSASSLFQSEERDTPSQSVDFERLETGSSSKPSRKLVKTLWAEPTHSEGQSQTSLRGDSTVEEAIRNALSNTLLSKKDSSVPKRATAVSARDRIADNDGPMSVSAVIENMERAATSSIVDDQQMIPERQVRTWDCHRGTEKSKHRFTGDLLPSGDSSSTSVDTDYGEGGMEDHNNETRCELEDLVQHDVVPAGISDLQFDPICLTAPDGFRGSGAREHSALAGVYYGTSSPSVLDQIGPDGEIVTSKTLADYPEYAVLKVTAKEDSVLGSEPNTPIAGSSPDWGTSFNDAFLMNDEIGGGNLIVKKEGDLNEAVENGVPEVLLHDWSGSTPVEPNVEMVDSSPNSRSSSPHVFGTEKNGPTGMKGGDGNVVRPSEPHSTDNSRRFRRSIDRIESDTLSRLRDTATVTSSASAMTRTGDFAGVVSHFPTSRGHSQLSERRSKEREREGDGGEEGEVPSVGRHGEAWVSSHYEVKEPHTMPDREKMSRKATSNVGIAGEQGNDVQLSVDRKSFSEIGYRRGVRMIGRGTSFVERDTHRRERSSEPMGDSRAAGRDGKDNGRRRPTPQRRRRLSNVETSVEVAGREDGSSLRGMVGRLVSGMHMAKRLVSPN